MGSLQPSKITFYANLTTKKVIPVHKYNALSDKSGFKKFAHYGFHSDYKNGDFIIGNYTTRNKSVLKLEEQKVIYENKLNLYSDSKYFNEIKIYSHKIKEYFLIEKDFPGFINFFKKRELSGAMGFEILDKTIKDFYQSVINSSVGGELNRVEIGIADERVKCEDLILSARMGLKLDDYDDVTYRETVVKEIMEANKDSLEFCKDLF